MVKTLIDSTTLVSYRNDLTGTKEDPFEVKVSFYKEDIRMLEGDNWSFNKEKCTRVYFYGNEESAIVNELYNDFYFKVHGVKPPRLIKKSPTI